MLSATTGRINALLHPVTFDIETRLTEVGAGTLDLRIQDVTAAQLRPWQNLVAFTRMCGCDEPETWVFVVDRATANAQQGVSLGLVTIEAWLYRQYLFSPDEESSTVGVVTGADGSRKLTYDGTSQTLVAKDLVDRALDTCSFPLAAIALPSGNVVGSGPNAFASNEWDHENIGELLDDLADLVNGIEWRVTSKREAGYVLSSITFADKLGSNLTTVLRGESVANWSVEMNGDNLANYATGIGAGMEADQKTVDRSVQSQTPNLPCLGAVPAWKNRTSLTSLRRLTEGYLEVNKTPQIRPSFEQIGFDPCPVALGDTIGVDACIGPFDFSGDTRIVSRAWSVDDANSQTLGLDPVPGSFTTGTRDCPCEDC